MRPHHQDFVNAVKCNNVLWIAYEEYKTKFGEFERLHKEAYKKCLDDLQSDDFSAACNAVQVVVGADGRTWASLGRSRCMEPMYVFVNQWLEAQAHTTLVSDESVLLDCIQRKDVLQLMVDAIDVMPSAMNNGKLQGIRADAITIKRDLEKRDNRYALVNKCRGFDHTLDYAAEMDEVLTACIGSTLSPDESQVLTECRTSLLKCIHVEVSKTDVTESDVSQYRSTLEKINELDFELSKSVGDCKAPLSIIDKGMAVVQAKTSFTDLAASAEFKVKGSLLQAMNAAAREYGTDPYVLQLNSETDVELSKSLTQPYWIKGIKLAFDKHMRSASAIVESTVKELGI